MNDICRRNHYVPVWYQKGFLNGNRTLHYLDLDPKPIFQQSNGKKHRDYWQSTPKKCFYEKDIYNIIFNNQVFDDIEKDFFGSIDKHGKSAMTAFLSDDFTMRHKYFQKFFETISAQKIRTPKGLTWLKNQYTLIDHNSLLLELTKLSKLYCLIFTECVREIVSAKEANSKFIFSDHPVITYHPLYQPTSQEHKCSNEPSLFMNGSQTIFPLDQDHCLILTHLDYAKAPRSIDLKAKRENARYFDTGITKTTSLIKKRLLKSIEVMSINNIIKLQSSKIAGSNKEDLYPEKIIDEPWRKYAEILLPPQEELYQFGGEIFVSYDSGHTTYQDPYGRKDKYHKLLEKTPPKNTKPNENCPCGSGKKFKKCCKSRNIEERPSWTTQSIRERNMTFINAICDILELNKFNDWVRVKQNLSSEKIKEIYEIYSYLWPLSTNILDLLPKDSKQSRCIYLGIIDIRNILQFATSSVLYFDETIIINPFINPLTRKPEFNPTNKPEEFVIDTLNHCLIFLALEPFIRNGSINFIPNPMDFNYGLREKIFSLSEQRKADHSILYKSPLKEDDLKMFHLMNGQQNWITSIQKQFPKISQKMLEECLKMMEVEKERHPLIPLQGNILDTAQQITFNLMPNFELAIFLGEITGSTIVTDSSFRFNEFVNNCSIENNNYTAIKAFFENNAFIKFPDITDLHEAYIGGYLGKTKKDFIYLLNTILEEKNVDHKYIDLSNEYITKENKKNFIGKAPMQIKCFIPTNGASTHDTRRISISYNFYNKNKIPAILLFC